MSWVIDAFKELIPKRKEKKKKMTDDKNIPEIPVLPKEEAVQPVEQPEPELPKFETPTEPEPIISVEDRLNQLETATNNHAEIINMLGDRLTAVERFLIKFGGK